MVENTKALSGLAILAIVIGLSLIGSVTLRAEEAAIGNTLRREAPIYTGPIEEENLEKLTEEDFDMFGTDADTPAEQYHQYQKLLMQPAFGGPILYKMRIVDRDLSMDDFTGFDVPPALVQARYDGYLGMNPVTEDGHTIHYVFVYHSRISREESENAEVDRDLSIPLGNE